MFFKKKINKDLNIINFGKGTWGNDIVLDKIIKKDICKMHGWYFGFGLICSDNNLTKDSLVIKETPKGYWYGRVLKIERVSDPNDMFFAIVRSITKDSMLSKQELQYLENNKLLNTMEISNG